MPEPDREAAIDRLHAVALEEFVGERTRLARAIRSDGDRAAAAEIAKLAKPSPPAWALNHVARQHPDRVVEWLEAASALRETSARAAKGGGDALRLAMVEHRAATLRLVAVVRDRAQPSGRPLSEAMLDRLRGLLQAATIDERLAEELRQGRIAEPADPTESEPEVQMAEVKHSPRPAKAPQKTPTKEDRAAVKRAERRAELEHRIATVSDVLDRLTEEADRRAATAKSAEERLEEAVRAAHRLESEADAAREAAAEADKSARSAERELEGLRARL